MGLGGVRGFEGRISIKLKKRLLCTQRPHSANWGQKQRRLEDRLLAALKNPELRSTAAHTLGQIGAHSLEAVAVLIDLLKNAPEKDARCSAAGSLGAFGPAAKAAIPALHAALKEEAKGGWWVAADTLGNIGGADVVPILIEALSHADDDIRLSSMSPR